MRCKYCEAELNPSRGDLLVRVSVTEHTLIGTRGCDPCIWEETTDQGTFCDGLCLSTYIDEHKKWYTQQTESSLN